MKKNKNKDKRKKRGFRIFLVILFFTVLIGFIFLLLGAYVFETKIKTIVVHDNNILTDEEIIALAELENYPNFYLTTSSSIEKNIEKSDFIEKVEVKKNLFFEVDIYVTENKPLFIREDTDKIVFQDGQEIANSNEYNLDIPHLVNYVPDTKYSDLLKKMNSINYKIVKKISDIRYYPNKYDEDRFLLYMNDSNRVYINLPKFKSLNKYDEMVTKFEGKTGVLYLDSGNYFEIDD